MFLEALILSIIIGLIRGGKIRRIKMLNSGSIWVLLLGIVTQYLLSFLSLLEDNGNINVILKYITQIQIFSYILIFIGIILNLNIKSLWTLFAGYGLNFMSLALNGWSIPNLIADPTQNVKFPTLGYTIEFFEPYPLPKILTLGDIIISFGIFSLIQEVMLGGSTHGRGYRF